MTVATAPSDRQFARLLCDHAESAASGILTASRGKLRRLFCLEKGWIVFATSNLLEEQFIDFLVRRGALTAQAGAEVVLDSARANAKPGAYLLAQNKLDPDDLRSALEALVREIATSTLEWPDGAFKFEDGLPKLDGEVKVRLAPRSLVLAHARRYPSSVDALRIRIGPPDLRPVVSPTVDDDGLTLDTLGSYLMVRCDGLSELSDIVKDSPSSEEATLRAVYGFLMAGILHPEDPTVRRERESRAREDTLTREECLGRLTMVAGQDHYGVLNIDRTARAKSVREAYYALARRYHPDRFRSGPLTDLLPKFEDFFMLVTNAYNTLIDKDLRAEYDAEATNVQVADPKTADTGYLARQNFLRGRALAAQRKYTEAVTFLENAVTLDPGQADFHLELGLVLSRNPRHREEAERRLLQAIELAPATVGAYVALGQMYLKARKLGRAGRMAREALRWEPGHLEAGRIVAEAGDAPDEPDALRQGVFRSS